MSPVGAARAGVVGARAGPAIPDSGLYHYPLLERSNPTLVEELQNANGTATGLTNISDTWWEGYAESGDGSDDFGSLPIDSFGSALDNPTYVAFTVEYSDTSAGRLMGAFEGSSSMSLQFLQEGQFFTDAGEFGIALQGNDGNFSQATVPAFNDGSKHRVVINLNNSDVSGWEVYVDATAETVTVDADNTPHTLVDFTNPFYTHAMNNQGSIATPIAADLDNLVFGAKNLSASEVQDDYNRQPWST